MGVNSRKIKGYFGVYWWTVQDFILFFLVEVGELCWWWVEDFAKKCEPFEKDDEIHCVLPNVSYEDGLFGVYHDNKVRELDKSITECKMVKCLVVKGNEREKLRRLLGKQTQAPTSFEITSIVENSQPNSSQKPSGTPANPIDLHAINALLVLPKGPCPNKSIVGSTTKKVWPTGK